MFILSALKYIFKEKNTQQEPYSKIQNSGFLNKNLPFFLKA